MDTLNEYGRLEGIFSAQKLVKEIYVSTLTNVIVKEM